MFSTKLFHKTRNGQVIWGYSVLALLGQLLMILMIIPICRSQHLLSYNTSLSRNMWVKYVSGFAWRIVMIFFRIEPSYGYIASIFEYSMSWKSATLSGNFWKLFSKMGGCLRQMAQYKRIGSVLSFYKRTQGKNASFLSHHLTKQVCSSIFYSWEKEDRIIDHREIFKLRFMFFQPTQDVT